MKKLFTIAIIIGSMSVLNAQTIVSTAPQNKKVLVEEFTGTSCPNCPGGHTTAAQLLAANPGNLFVVAYHPNNSSYTVGDPMATVFPATFYAIPFISPTQRYMPSAMINRRVWGGVERIQGTGSWTSDGNTIKAEASPLNVGVGSNYNSSTKNLTVSIEVYFTAAVTDALTLYVELTEDGIIATQSGGTNPYTHNHVFRESLVAQWGDAIAAPTSLGTLKTFTFNFDNTTAAYDMSKCEVIAFVRNSVDEEIISVNGSPVGQSTAINHDNNISNSIKVFPNPAKEISTLNISLVSPEKVNYSLLNIMGQEVISDELGQLQSGIHNIEMNNLDGLQKGIYFLKVTIGNENYSQKLILE